MLLNNKNYSRINVRPLQMNAPPTNSLERNICTRGIQLSLEWEDKKSYTSLIKIHSPFHLFSVLDPIILYAVSYFINENSLTCNGVSWHRFGHV